MSRSTMLGLIVILAIVLVVVGIYAYRESQRPGLEINVDGNGLKINGNG